MRPESIVLLVVAALQACVDGASSKLVAVDFPVTDHSLASNQDTIPAKRLLRVSETTNQYDEERVDLAGLAKAGASKVTGATSTLSSWLYHNANGVQVLRNLQLGDDIAAALRSSKLEMLRNYVAMFNEKHPNSKISVIGTLTAHYGDDVVAMALVTAQRRQGTKALATQLREDQLAGWLKNDKSVVDVFKLLNLGDDGYQALTSQKLDVLDDYITLFNRKKLAEKTLLATLSTGFGGERKLAKLLITAKEDITTRGRALELQSELFNKWFARKLQPDEILQGLKLGDNVQEALNDINLQTLINYISFVNKKNPANEVSLIGTLTAHYGDAIVLKALIAAKGVHSTKDIATVLQLQQLEGWLTSGKSVDDVYALLKFPEDDLAVFVSPELGVLEDYIKLFNRQKSGDETVVKALAVGFGGDDQLAMALEDARRYPLLNAKVTQLQKAQFARWKDEGIDSTNILAKVFKVGETEGTTPLEESIVKRFTSF
ncbi:putative secreted RxLR effector protein [Phytophthora cinnamomi]|uniref:putative secreted RxLR effector protein n=1 Tax=Phytophthora cinnamomi TaxID=4785 RepID=UPI003559A182|nr:putative secreted RxLR effector protein [Phytophthora cinnamomi]